MTRSAFLALALLLAAIPGAAAPPLPTPLLLPAAANPPGLRWLELSSEHFRIIFPEELRDDAGYCADLMEHLRGGLSAGFEAGVGRTTIVLSNQQGTANGYVGFFPRRSEWFHVPPAESLLGSLEWYSLLATHEGRRVAQLAEERRGSVLAAYVLLGELGEAALLLGLGAPSWFLEGDAVLTETLATESGRGRPPRLPAAAARGRPRGRPAHLAPGRVRLLPPGVRQPLRAGLPAHRPHPPRLRPAGGRGDPARGGALGGRPRRLRAQCPAGDRPVHRRAAATAPPWPAGGGRRDGGGGPARPVRPLLADTGGALRDAAEYRSPAGVRGGTVALKASLSQEPALVLIDGEGRERVLRPALAPVGMSAREDRVVWAQLFPDTRWGNRTRTDLVELRLSTGEVRRLTRGRVIQSPAVAAGGARVAAVEVLPQRVSRLVVFGPDGGEEEVHRAAAGAHLQEPAWSPDGRRLYVYETSAAGKGLLELTPREPARPPGRAGLRRAGRPAGCCPRGGRTWKAWMPGAAWALFGSDRGGPMNALALPHGTGEVRQVTSRPAERDRGARGERRRAALLGRRGAGAAAGRHGAAPRRMAAGGGAAGGGATRAAGGRFPADRGVGGAGTAARRAAGAPAELRGAPLPAGCGGDPALRLAAGRLGGRGGGGRGGPGDPFLGDAAGPLAGPARRPGLAGAAGRKPRWSWSSGVLSPGGSRGAAFEQRDYPGTEEAAQALLGSLGVRLPLSLDGIGWRQGLALEGAWEAGAVWARGRDPLAVQALTGALGWFLSRRTAPRDLAPRWGLALDAIGRAELAGGAADGEGGALSTLPAPGFSATATAWLPGLGRHHSLRFEVVYADDETGSLYQVLRGYAGDPFEEAAVAGASVEYRLPLAYPDAGLGSGCTCRA